MTHSDLLLKRNNGWASFELDPGPHEAYGDLYEGIRTSLGGDSPVEAGHSGCLGRGVL